jgi:site-specific recombinase XerD
MYTHWSPPAAWEAQFLYYLLYTLLQVGINIALRISDLLELCVEHFVFFNTKANNFMQPIKRGQAWKVITTIYQEVGLCGSYGTHSLRKTWGYHARLQGVDLALIMHKLNHSNITTTKRYLSITDDELQEVVQRLNL